MNAVDRFVIYDDVYFIKGGWINRNRILVNGGAKYLTTPVHKQSQNSLIKDLRLLDDNVWRSKLLRMLEFSYRKAPYYESVYPILREIIGSEETNLSIYLQTALNRLSSWLGIDTEFIVSSEKFNNNHLVGQERIIDICKAEKADIYLNLPGGMSLYDAKGFQNNSIELKFLCPLDICYRQFDKEFAPHLSIIDVIMFNGQSGTRKFLEDFTLENAA